MDSPLVHHHGRTLIRPTRRAKHHRSTRYLELALHFPIAPSPASLTPLMGSLIKKRRKRMRKKKHKKMLKATRWQRRAGR